MDGWMTGDREVDGQVTNRSKMTFVLLVLSLSSGYMTGDTVTN